MVRKLLLIILVSISTLRSQACLILFLSDGNEVLVGNHEDWFAKDAVVRINPPSAGKFGSVIFTFQSEGWAQGGMNERGLFFDGALTPFQEVEFESHQKFPGHIWQSILDKCSTVDEALKLLITYELPQLQETHIMLADASGRAALIGVKNGKLAIRQTRGPHLLQTNFNPWNPELSEEPVCRRYQFAETSLEKDNEVSVENMRSILKQTHQDSLTVYSNIYDLKNKIVYTYNKRDFDHPIVVRLPEYFRYGNCQALLDSLAKNPGSWNACSVKKSNMAGRVVDVKTGEGIPYVNIGLLHKNVGTLSDPDGSFELELPGDYENEPVIFSSIGFESQSVTGAGGDNITVRLTPAVTMLDPVIVKDKRKLKRVRLGWMGGKDGILPFDTVQGGGVVALLVEVPRQDAYVEKLQVRLMYNSKDTLLFRLHLYAFDTIAQVPGRELLAKEILLRETGRFGWLRFDLAKHEIELHEKKFCVGFEWIDDRDTRRKMHAGLLHWEQWKKEQFDSGDTRVEQLVSRSPEGQEIVSYKYHGNMMNWPGFRSLPPFTGLMVETGKRSETQHLRTFQRKTSFGTWTELPSTLNTVITITY